MIAGYIYEVYLLANPTRATNSTTERIGHRAARLPVKVYTCLSARGARSLENFRQCLRTFSPATMNEGYNKSYDRLD